MSRRRRPELRTTTLARRFGGVRYSLATPLSERLHAGRRRAHPVPPAANRRFHSASSARGRNGRRFSNPPPRPAAHPGVLDVISSSTSPLSRSSRGHSLVARASASTPATPRTSMPRAGRPAHAPSAGRGRRSRFEGPSRGSLDPSERGDIRRSSDFGPLSVTGEPGTTRLPPGYWSPDVA